MRKTKAPWRKCSNCIALDRESSCSPPVGKRFGKSNYRLLLQLGDDRALFAVHQRFSVRAVALVEPDGSGGVLVQNLFSVRSSRFQVAILKEDHHHVFIMEVHRRGDARSPGGVPHDYAIILK